LVRFRSRQSVAGNLQFATFRRLQVVDLWSFRQQPEQMRQSIEQFTDFLHPLALQVSNNWADVFMLTRSHFGRALTTLYGFSPTFTTLACFSQVSRECNVCTHSRAYTGSPLTNPSGGASGG
jgi:hypothetical protein